MDRLVPDYCPVFKSACREESCPLWMVLDDWEGCSMAGALQWMYDIMTEGAKQLDEILAIQRGPPEDGGG